MPTVDSRSPIRLAERSKASASSLSSTDIGADVAVDAITAFLDLLRALRSGDLSLDDVVAFLTHRPIGGTVAVRCDPHGRPIVPINPLAAIKSLGRLNE